MSRRGWGQLIAATCWASSDSSSLVWSASSKSPGSFVIQPHVTTIWYLKLFLKGLRGQPSCHCPDGRRPSLSVTCWTSPRFACHHSSGILYLSRFWRLNSDANAFWMDMVNGGSWSLSLLEWWVVPHMATIWYGKAVLRLWMTRCGLRGSDGFHQFFWVLHGSSRAPAGARQDISAVA